MPTKGKSAPSCAPEAKLRKSAQGKTKLALDTLTELMKAPGTQASVKLGAAREVLDRAYGKPKAGDPETSSEALTVVVRRFTDAVDPEADEYPEDDE